jgi:hypothetical protein
MHLDVARLVEAGAAGASVETFAFPDGADGSAELAATELQGGLGSP